MSDWDKPLSLPVTDHPGSTRRQGTLSTTNDFADTPQEDKDTNDTINHNPSKPPSQADSCWEDLAMTEDDPERMYFDALLDDDSSLIIPPMERSNTPKSNTTTTSVQQPAAALKDDNEIGLDPLPSIETSDSDIEPSTTGIAPMDHHTDSVVARRRDDDDHSEDSSPNSTSSVLHTTTTTTTHRGPSHRSSRKKPSGAPKRPLSAYNLFFQQERLAIYAKETNITFESLGKRIGQRWQSLNVKDKRVYEQLAEKEAERYQQEKTAYRQQQQLRKRNRSSFRKNDPLKKCFTPRTKRVVFDETVYGDNSEQGTFPMPSPIQPPPPPLSRDPFDDAFPSTNSPPNTRNPIPVVSSNSSSIRRPSMDPSSLHNTSHSSYTTSAAFTTISSSSSLPLIQVLLPTTTADGDQEPQRFVVTYQLVRTTASQAQAYVAHLSDYIARYGRPVPNVRQPPAAPAPL